MTEMSNEWHTPVELARDLQRGVGGQYDLDPASGCEPTPIAATRYTKADDGLAQPWFGRVFVNPPYDRTISDWMEKSHREVEQDRVETVVSLVPARVSTQWWHNHVGAAELVCLVEGRLRFGGADSNARFPSAIAVFGEVTGTLKNVLEDHGEVYEPRDVPPITELAVGSELEIAVDDRCPGFPSGVDSHARVTVLTADETDAGTVEMLTVQSEHYGQDHETYFLVSFPLEDPADVRVSVQHMDMDPYPRWWTVPMDGLTVQSDPNGPDPFQWVA